MIINNGTLVEAGCSRRRTGSIDRERSFLARTQFILHRCTGKGAGFSRRRTRYSIANVRLVRKSAHLLAEDTLMQFCKFMASAGTLDSRAVGEHYDGACRMTGSDETGTLDEQDDDTGTGTAERLQQEHLGFSGAGAHFHFFGASRMTLEMMRLEHLKSRATTQEFRNRRIFRALWVVNPHKIFKLMNLLNFTNPPRRTNFGVARTSSSGLQTNLFKVKCHEII